jgi:biopolymer transport protein ExbD
VYQHTRYQELAEIMAAAQTAGLHEPGFTTDPSHDR